MFWKIREFIRRKYLKHKYGNAEKRIDYEWHLHTYVHPDYINYCDYFNIENLAEELCHNSLYYGVEINGHDWHEHEFSRVIEDAYNYAETFEIPPECKDEYSKQELEFLMALVEAGKRDRQYIEKPRYEEMSCPNE